MKYWWAGNKLFPNWSNLRGTALKCNVVLCFCCKWKDFEAAFKMKCLIWRYVCQNTAGVMPGLVQQKIKQKQRLEIFYREQYCKQVVTHQSMNRSLSLPSFEGCIVFLIWKTMLPHVKSTLIWAVSLVLVASVPVGITFVSSLNCDIWEEGFTAFLRPWQNAVGSLRLTWWNVFSSKCWPGMGPCFPTHCNQFSLPSLEKIHPVISSQ